MARTRVLGAVNRDTNYEVLAKKPIDARSLVKTYDDLTNIDNWVTSSGNPIVYNGMIVAVWLNTADPSRNGIYFLHDASVTSAKGTPDATNEANWHKLADADGLVDKLSLIDDRLTALEEKESDVVTYGYRSGFPTTGEANKLYVAADEGKSYVWFNDDYLPVGGSEYEEPAVIYGGSAD
jgi:hypothetical protein